MTLPRYPRYKDSGVEWLGEVPGHWEVDRLKRSTLVCKNGIWGDEPQQNDDDIPCVRVADFDRQRLRVELSEPTIRNVNEKERNGRILRQGDLLLEKSGGGEFQPVGCVVLYDDPLPAVCSNFVARVQVIDGMSSSFWRYVHAAAYAVRLNTRSIKQTSGIQNLDQQQYLDELAPFPPFAEQTQIAAFLDRETAKIDTLVAEQRRLMALLKEKRQAVISRAVTRGLNPDAPLKPSGIEWLGDMPAHWDIKKTKYLTSRISSGKTPLGGSEVYVDEGITFLRSQNVYDEGLRLEEVVYIAPAVDEAMAVSRVCEHDILLNVTGASIGRSCVVPTGFPRANVNQHVCVIRLTDLARVPFMAWVFKGSSIKNQIDHAQNGAAREGLNFEQISEMLFGLPPSDEQICITDFLKSETAKLDTLTTEAQRAIDLLQERRTALISAAVTGQIDVRSAVASY